MYHAVRRSLRSICKLRNEVRCSAVKDIFTKERVIKMKCIWKYVVVAACVLLCLPLLFGCSKNKDQIMIYSTSEDFRNEYVRKRLKEEFPDLDIKVEVLLKKEPSKVASIRCEAYDALTRESYPQSCFPRARRLTATSYWSWNPLIWKSWVIRSVRSTASFRLINMWRSLYLKTTDMFRGAA